MDCNNAKELLSVFVFDEIEEVNRLRLAAHLQVCGACTRNLENFRVVREALDELPDPEVPGDFLVGVRARIEQPVTWVDTVDETLATLTGRRVMTGASLALAAGFAFLVGNTSGDLSAPPMQAAGVRQESDALAPAAPRSSAGLGEAVAGTGEGRERNKDASMEGAEGGRRDADLGRSGRSAPVAGSLRAAAASAPVAEPEVAAAPPARDKTSRPRAAESFDDVFGEREAEEAPAPAAPPPPPADPEPTRVAARAKAAARAPTSPFLESMASRSGVEKRAPAAELSSMGANELGRELARLEEFRRSRRMRRAAEAGLSIFSPAGDEAPGGMSDFADDDAALDAASGFGGGTGLARVSDGDPYDGGAGDGSWRGDLFADAPRVAPVTIAFLRTTFGRSVHVLRPTQVSRFPAQVGRDLGLRSQDPRGALEGIHALLESGLGLKLQGVEMRQGEEVSLLVGFAPGQPGQQALDRFVENLRGLAGTALASDVASVSGGELGRLARVTVPTP